MSWTDKLLPLWIVAAMVLGVLLGVYVPSIKSAFAVADVGGVSLPIALGLWLMMWPVLTKVLLLLCCVLVFVASGLCALPRLLPPATNQPTKKKVRYEALGVLLAQKQVAKAFGISFVLNWVLGPALMTGLAWACLPDLPGYRNGAHCFFVAVVVLRSGGCSGDVGCRRVCAPPSLTPRA